MATYYIKTYADGGRDESGRDGSVGQEWATPSYASGRVTTSGDVIDIASGNYTDNNHFVLSLGVSAVGKVISRPCIFTSYAVSSSYDGYVRMYSSSQTNGNQSISYIDFVGNSLACARAIYVQYRDNVTIHHCNINDFLAAGIFFNNEESWDVEPNNLALDCSIHHCNITNCSDRNYDPEALLRLKGMKNLTCYSNVLTNNERSAGQNGNIISASFLENCKFHDNQYFKNDSENGEWNFFVELFHPRGGTEFYDETFFGAATLDLGGAPNFGAERGTYDYSLSIHHCTFTTSTGAQLSVRNGTEPNGKHHIAIDLETNLEYIYVYNNRIRHYAIGVGLVTSTLSQVYNQNHVYIYNNIMEDMGYSSYQYNYGIYVNNEGNPVAYSGTTDNLHIWNNVINGAGNNSHGIIWHMRGTCTNSSIKNNIITGFDTTAVTISRQTDAGDTLYLTDVLVNYNDFYNNGSNDVTESGITGKTSCNFTTGNITNDPLFVDSNFNLNETTSPCLYTGITVALNYDYNGNPWATPNPSMGVYEYGTEEPVDSLLGAINGITTVSGHLNGGPIFSIPDTLDFTLQDVCDVVSPDYDTLVDCFNFAIAELFDPRYEGDHDRLSNFRNYGGEFANSLIGVTNGVSTVSATGSVLADYEIDPGTIGDSQDACYHTPWEEDLHFITSPSDGVAPYAYQWYASINNVDFSYVSGATQNTYLTFLNSSRYYRCRVTDANNVVAYTNSVLITVIAPLAAGTICCAQSIDYGDTPASLYETVAATTGTPGPITYAWHYASASTSWNYITIDGATSTGYSPGPLTETTYFRRVAHDEYTGLCGGGSVSTASIQITVGAEVFWTISAGAGTGGSIDPSGDTEVANGTNRTFYISANSGYAIDDVLVDDVSQGDIDEYTFYNVTSDHSISVSFVVSDALNPGIIGEDDTVCNSTSPDNLHFNTSPSGGISPYFYQWQQYISGSWSNINGETSNNYDPPSLTSSTQYRCRVTDSVSAVDYTNTVSITVYGVLLPGSLSFTSPVEYNTVPPPITQLTAASGSSGNYTYSWYSSLNGSDWSIINGQTGTSYTPTSPITVDTWYARRVHDSICTGDEATVSVQVVCGEEYTYWTIAASAGSNGNINPSGNVQVLEGSYRTFYFNPDTGYTVSDVLVDSVSQGDLDEYTFTNVIANHTISVSFVLIETITTSGFSLYTGGGNGEIYFDTMTSWNDCHTAIQGLVDYNDPYRVGVAYDFDNQIWSIRRLYLCFDLSSLADRECVSVQLRIGVRSRTGTTSNIYGMVGSQQLTLQTTDFHAFTAGDYILSGAQGNVSQPACGTGDLTYHYLSATASECEAMQNNHFGNLFEIAVIHEYDAFNIEPDPNTDSTNNFWQAGECLTNCVCAPVLIIEHRAL